jgi:hypothetical protein
LLEIGHQIQFNFRRVLTQHAAVGNIGICSSGAITVLNSSVTSRKTIAYAYCAGVGAVVLAAGTGLSISPVVGAVVMILINFDDTQSVTFQLPDKGPLSVWSLYGQRTPLPANPTPEQVLSLVTSPSIVSDAARFLINANLFIHFHFHLEMTIELSYF